MHIIINLASIYGNGAFNRERNLLRALSDIDPKNEYTIIGRENQIADLYELGANFNVHPVNIGDNFFSRFLWENLTLPRLVKNNCGDLLLFPFHRTNIFDVVPKLIVVRNAAPFCDHVIQSSSPYQKIRLLMLRLGTWFSIQRADHVAFVTETMRSLVSQRFKLENINTSVIPHGIPSGFFPRNKNECKDVLASYGVKLPFILWVGLIAAYKNIIEMLMAYRMACEKIEKIPPLYLIGSVYENNYLSKIKETISRFDLEKQVCFLGWVSHRELSFFYSTCSFFVSTTICESASIPHLEAMACGAPIVSSNWASIKELCQEAALYFNPKEPQEIASAMIKMLENERLRNSLQKKSLEQAATFSWEKSACQMLDIFNKIAKN